MRTPFALPLATGYIKCVKLRPRLFLSLLLLLAACARPVEMPGSPPPAQALLRENGIDLGRQGFIPGHQWMPQNPRAILYAIHGMNDYSHSFTAAGLYLAEHGVGMVALDQRGFGRNVSPGIWAGKANLLSDTFTALASIHRQHPGVPLYLLGESMGGAVAVLSAADPRMQQAGVEGLILSAPAVWGGSAMNIFMRGFSWWGAHTFPELKMTGKQLKIKPSDNIPMLIALGRDPLVIKATRLDSIYGLVGLMGDAQREIAHVTLPTLYLYGANDQVIPPEPTASAILKLHAPNRVVYYPNGYHMLLRDLQAQRVWDDILAWIADKNAPMPSGDEMHPRALRGKTGLASPPPNMQSRKKLPRLIKF